MIPIALKELYLILF